MQAYSDPKRQNDRNAEAAGWRALTSQSVYRTRPRTAAEQAMAQAIRVADHSMLCRLANKAHAAGNIALAESYERGAEMVARLFHANADGNP